MNSPLQLAAPHGVAWGSGPPSLLAPGAASRPVPSRRTDAASP
eukprot:CAMPEP_0194338590 /NCGR_PEP_ID=MMETSP0171-20130528/80128_1 /TAXON_ID=218684 /ORGANISM="Corethron pennatum, Strain L29A3" /LENGTH=42 /DNA_ID= /DNA_START= /DNA_END= /DNA_ORIENTATION=